MNVEAPSKPNGSCQVTARSKRNTRMVCDGYFCLAAVIDPRNVILASASTPSQCAVCCSLP